MIFFKTLHNNPKSVFVVAILPFEFPQRFCRWLGESHSTQIERKQMRETSSRLVEVNVIILELKGANIERVNARKAAQRN
jgi:hypothetical protein